MLIIDIDINYIDIDIRNYSRVVEMSISLPFNNVLHIIVEGIYVRRVRWPHGWCNVAVQIGRNLILGHQSFLSTFRVPLEHIQRGLCLVCNDIQGISRVSQMFPALKPIAFLKKEKLAWRVLSLIINLKTITEPGNLLCITLGTSERPVHEHLVELLILNEFLFVW